MARHESEMHRELRELRAAMQLANQRITELCSTVNTLAKFRKVRAEDYVVQSSQG